MQAKAEPSVLESAPALPFAALVLGALAMAISPTFVRLAEVGPFASAFWRAAGALPLLWLWAAYEARSAGEPLRTTFSIDTPIVIAGLAFAGDLLFWHLAILHTTVANATFLANLAPVWVALGSGWLIGEAVGRRTAWGLLICVAGIIVLVGTSYSFAPERLLGDACGVVTSLFFGIYFLAVRRGRRASTGAGRTVFLTALITSLALLIVALLFEDRMLPDTPGGAAALAGLALVSHAGGQGFLIYALGHLPAAFSSLVIFIEAPSAALFGWIFLGEPMTLLQIAGGALILLGIAAARPERAKPAPSPAMIPPSSETKRTIPAAQKRR